MAEVKILVKGYYTNEESGQEKTCPTITLIKDNNIIIVVDPGILKDQKILTDKLKEEKLTVDDINIVCITHSHIDHYRNIGMFPKAKVLEYFGVWDKDTVDDWDEQLTNNIKIIKTPGHDRTSITLLVKTEKGKIAICGDVFWKENFPEKDPYATDKEKLEKSRKNVLEIADYVIPGHAGMFKV